MSVTLAELKDHLRITWDDEDSSLSVYLAGALDYVETFTGQKLSRIARNSYFDDFSNLELVGDSPSSVSVSYVDDDGADQTLSSAVYALKTHKARPYLALAYNQSWPSYREQDAVITVSYTSGYSTTTLPASLKAAVLLEAGSQYEHREGETMLKLNDRKVVEKLARPYRVYNL